jgi:hypothetical protein
VFTILPTIEDAGTTCPTGTPVAMHEGTQIGQIGVPA